jgi:hypothetical protein
LLLLYFGPKNQHISKQQIIYAKRLILNKAKSKDVSVILRLMWQGLALLTQFFSGRDIMSSLTATLKEVCYEKVG